MITAKTEMRELIVLPGGGVSMHATHHIAGPGLNGAAGSRSNVGVVFVNSLFSPRSLIGDAGVHWATALALRGYPSFRFDLPGLGDTYGEIPNDLVRFTSLGGFAAVAASKAKELVKSLSLSGVVMFGHCAGANTAIFAASECRDCKGLILLDPYFNLPNSLTPSLRPEIVHWARQSPVGAFLGAMYDRMREARKAWAKGALPANANFHLIACLKQVVANGTPILILKAPPPPVIGGNALRAGSFDYLEHVGSLAKRGSQVSIRTVDGTDHSFANRTGRLAVLQCLESWLGEHFPVGKPKPHLV